MRIGNGDLMASGLELKFAFSPNHIISYDIDPRRNRPVMLGKKKEMGPNNGPQRGGDKVVVIVAHAESEMVVRSTEATNKNLEELEGTRKRSEG